MKNVPLALLSCCVVTLTACPIATAAVPKPKEQVWHHQHWRAFTETAATIKTCIITTGRAGEHQFTVKIESGGVNGSAYFTERMLKGQPPVMQRDDDIVFQFEGVKPLTYDYDIFVYLDPARDGAVTATAGIVTSYVPEITQAMRKSRALTILRANPTTNKRDVLHRFSLMGFSAVWHRVASWCQFDPDNIFAS